MKNYYCVIMVSAPSGRKAHDIAARLLKERVAACVNIVPRVESIYWWKGKIESAAESLLLIKTQRKHVVPLTRLVKKIHPYEVPEIIVLPILSGNVSYLKWLRDET